jgi:hypothetical protein
MTDYKFPATVLKRATPVEQLMSIVADKRAIDPTSLEGAEPFFFMAEISNNRLDSYYTRMGQDTLTNFANDAAMGISFQDSHDTRKLGFGMSLTGMVEPLPESTVTTPLLRALAEFYTVPGIRFGGEHSYASTDDFIRAVRTGLARDVSVGFYGGDMICDICGNSYYDWANCVHIPGLEYPIGERGEETILSTFTIENAHLSEVSAVYDGACPEAMILKMERSARDGALSPKAINLLQVRYRLKLPEGRAQWVGVDLKGRNQMEPVEQELIEETPVAAAVTEVVEEVAEEVTEVETEIVIEPVVEVAVTTPGEMSRVREQLQAAGAPDNLDVVAAAKWAANELTRLRPLADMGRQYRSDLVEDTIKEGIAAMGNTFPTEQYRSLLGTSNIETIKSIRDSFAAQAKALLGGGRKIKEEKEDNQETPRTPVTQERVNPEAYRA